MKSLLAIYLIVVMGPFVHAEIKPAVIKVSSFAEKKIEPNIMNINVQIWAKAETALQAQELSNKYVKKLKDLTEKFKVKKEDIRTDYFNVSPEYVYDPKTGASRLQNYSSIHQMTVTFKNLDLAGQFIDQSAKGDKNDKNKAGITISSIQWDSDKKGIAESECITAAVKNTRTRADDLAKAAGVTIKGVYMMSHQQIHSNFESQPMASSARMETMNKSVSADAYGSVDLSPGTIKVRADVAVEYLIQN